jgi:hypothetical protein
VTRKASSIGLIILLFPAVTPITPCHGSLTAAEASALTGSMPASCSSCRAIFQWRIAYLIPITSPG